MATIVKIAVATVVEKNIENSGNRTAVIAAIALAVTVAATAVIVINSNS